jgi:hypothetical protein
MTALKTLYGILFFAGWSAVGWITARHGQNMADV